MRALFQDIPKRKERYTESEKMRRRMSDGYISALKIKIVGSTKYLALYCQINFVIRIKFLLSLIFICLRRKTCSVGYIDI